MRMKRHRRDGKVPLLPEVCTAELSAQPSKNPSHGYYDDKQSTCAAYLFTSSSRPTPDWPALSRFVRQIRIQACARALSTPGCYVAKTNEADRGTCCTGNIGEGLFTAAHFSSQQARRERERDR